MPLAPFALDWELDTESNIFHINPFTGRLFGEGVRGEYLTTERFDEGLDQLLLAEIVCPENSYMGLLSARKFFEEQEQPLGVIFFPKPEDMLPYVNSYGQRAMQVVFLPPGLIEPEYLGLWYTDELEESYWDLDSPNFLWRGGPRT